MGRASPEVELIGELVMVDWGRERFSGGCYSAIGPGHRTLLDGFGRLGGPLGFAGEHVNGSGTIDGAIRSGQDAANSILSR